MRVKHFFIIKYFQIENVKALEYLRATDYVKGDHVEQQWALMFVCMYMDACVGLCVLWMASRIILNIFEVAPECLDIPLSILAQRLYKELCPQKPMRPEEKDEES